MDDENENASDWHDNSGFTSVELYPDGGYKSFVPEIDTEWMLKGQVVKLRASSTVTLYPSGGLERCVLASKTTLNVFGVTVAVAEGATLELHPNGEVRSLTLASQARWLRLEKKWKYRGATYDPGTTLVLSEEGAVVRREKRSDGGA
jgi:hypothetical protein